MVCNRTRPQFDGGHATRLRRCSGIDRAGLPDWIALVWYSLRVHPAELLGRTKTIVRIVTVGKVTSARRVCLSVVQSRAAARKSLDVRSVQNDVRYLRDASRLPVLLTTVSRSAVPRLRQSTSLERVGRPGVRNCEGVDYFRISGLTASWEGLPKRCELDKFRQLRRRIQNPSS